MKPLASRGGRKQENQGPSSDEFSQCHCHSTIATGQTECHDALPSSANDKVRCDCMFAEDGNAS